MEEKNIYRKLLASHTAFIIASGKATWFIKDSEEISSHDVIDELIKNHLDNDLLTAIDNDDDYYFKQIIEDDMGIEIVYTVEELLNKTTEHEYDNDPWQKDSNFNLGLEG